MHWAVLPCEFKKPGPQRWTPPPNNPPSYMQSSMLNVPNRKQSANDGLIEGDTGVLVTDGDGDRDTGEGVGERDTGVGEGDGVSDRDAMVGVTEGLIENDTL